MFLITVPEIGETVIDIDKVPGDYVWLSHDNNREEFEIRNFLGREIDSNRYLLCSTENINALCDYYFNYVFRYDFLRDMQSILSPGYDLWIGYYEQGKHTYGSMPTWVRQVVDYLINEKIIYFCKVENRGDEEENVYVMKDAKYFEQKSVSQAFVSELENICRKSVMEFWMDGEDFSCGCYPDEPDCGEWGKSLYEMLLLGVDADFLTD